MPDCREHPKVHEMGRRVFFCVFVYKNDEGYNVSLRLTLGRWQTVGHIP